MCGDGARASIGGDVRRVRTAAKLLLRPRRFLGPPRAIAHRRCGRRDRGKFDPAVAADREIEPDIADLALRSEEHTSELQSLMRISYAVFCLKKKTHNTPTENN